MFFINEVIEYLFGAALFVNALLFIPQAMTIFKQKTSAGLSLVTFLGFLLIQFAVVLHGIINADYLLLVGYLLSMVTCSLVVVLILAYKKPKQDFEVGGISLQEILEQFPEHVYWKDKDLNLIGSNTNNWRDFGAKSLSDYKGKTDYDILPKEEANTVRMFDKEIIKNGQPKVVEEKLTTLNGEKVLYLSHKAPLKNKHGKIVGILGISIDITNAKQEMTDRLKMLENIIAIMPGNVYWMNREGVYLGCNDNEAKHVGLSSRKEIIGKRNIDIPEFIMPEVLDPVNKKVMEEGKSIHLEEPAILHDGTTGTFLSSKVPLYDDRGNVTGMVGISIDITKEKQAQKALEAANNSRLGFISTASHEVRGPVSNVILLENFLEKNIAELQDLLQKDKYLSDTAITSLFGKIFERCHDIRNETEYALTALKNLGDLHRMQLNGVSTHLEYCDMQKLVEIAIKHCTYPNINQIEAVINIDPSVPKSIIVDFQNVVAALSIVIGNAFRFSHPNRKVLIQAQQSPRKEEELLIISVQDFGQGMHEAQIKNLSRTLFDGKTKEESIYIKPSIQLSRVKMYVEASGGSLEINSILDQGTTVQLFVPYKLSDKKQQAVSMADEYFESEQQTRNDTNVCSILLVEDNNIVQKTVFNMLAHLNYQVDTANNGTDAIQLALKNDYDIILLDISLPDISGLDVMRKVHEVKGDKSIFIAVSSHSSEDDEDYFMSQGAMTLLAKPIQEQQLLDAIDMALQIKTR
jgi:two-component system aerobic respiration control sensor histidine kinase ArcB